MVDNQKDERSRFRGRRLRLFRFRQEMVENPDFFERYGTSSG